MVLNSIGKKQLLQLPRAFSSLTQKSAYRRAIRDALLNKKVVYGYWDFP
jgi:hypothetical protein